MTEFETVAVNALVVRGIAVVVTDYHGLGTPATHDWLNRLAEAHAVLDAVRAAQRLAGTTIDSSGPVGLFGYSQGGGAAAAAAELQPTYAPELDLRGAYLGAPAVDPLAVLEAVDLMIGKGFIGFALNGLAADYPEAPTDPDYWRGSRQ
ncbi:alpha/beta fold hydrolase [Nocardia sp. NPDC058480]|uniref:alpha/beta fold hydrolase n=1 Tax=unclassified Nocardia TaxID=2637762 RepID=UPI003664793A